MITHFNREKLAKNLPDAYRKTDESNNAKILAAEKSALDSTRDAISAIYESLDINKAHGKTLDLYGETIGQPRGAATDEQFLVLIKNRIVRNFANADHDSIVKALCMTFDCEPSEILLTESDAPCRVKLEGIPIKSIVESNLDIDTATQIVFGLIPVGVYVESASFSGTFEFSGDEMEYNAEAGFGNEAQTIGGYLGYVASSVDRNLPV